MFLLIIIFVCNYITFPQAFLVITREKRYLNGTIPFTPITLDFYSYKFTFVLVLESFILQFVSIKFFKRNLVKTTIYDTINEKKE